MEKKKDLQKLASQRYMDQHAFYIGRGLDYAVAMEGTMKIKEVSYIHAEAFCRRRAEARDDCPD